MSGPTGPDGTPGQALLDEVRNGQVGSVFDLVGVADINQVQQAALQSRLHIPVMFFLDVIHGYKTIFPVPIAEASSSEPAAVPELIGRSRPMRPPLTGSSGPSTRWST